MNSLQVRAAAITLLALIPTVWFIVSRGMYYVALSILSTIVIAASLYYMFTSVDREIEWAKPL
jgi:hypothetical protein